MKTWRSVLAFCSEVLGYIGGGLILALAVAWRALGEHLDDGEGPQP